MCRGGFEGAERLSLAVTSRDFRVRGRHASVNRPGEREAGKLQRITCTHVSELLVTRLGLLASICQSTTRYQVMTRG